MSHAPSCCDDHDPAALTVEEARTRILASITSFSGQETIPLNQALGRVLTAPVTSPIDVPGHTNSAMDGYAVRSEDLPSQGERELQVIGTTLAGHPFEGTVKPGECVRIMTGAPLPAGTDTVIMQEHVEAKELHIRIGACHRKGQNIRLAGEDIARGGQILSAGKRLSPADIGVLASLGLAKVSVSPRVKVAFFTSGDELRPVGQPLAAGQIYDSNRYSLEALLTQEAFEPIDLGIVADDPSALRTALNHAADSADVVITSGGVSVGEADYIKTLLQEMGEMHLWKIAMKPGKPLTFGRLGKAWFFGLPGNPVSAMVTFMQFVSPALQKLAGMKTASPLRLTLPCRSRLKKAAGRVEFQRGILEQDESGQWAVRSTGAQGSGILTSMSMANCFIVLPRESTGAEIGDLVNVEPFCEFT